MSNNDDNFFTPDPDTLGDIFTTTRQQLVNGEITLTEANRIGDNMPEGWNFEFEEEDK